MTDWLTLLVIVLGFVLHPILYELSPLPEIVERIRARKKKKNWWQKVLKA